jgi:hypothetical protein
VLGGSTNTIAQDFDDLAKQSNYWWHIDNTKQFYFQAHNGTLAPWPLTANDVHIAWGITVKVDGTAFRTTPIIEGGTDTLLSSDEQFPTDGITKTFSVQYPIDLIASIKAGSQSYSVGIQGVDTGKDFYYTIGNKTFSQDAAATPLQPGLTLIPVYYGQLNVEAEVSSASHISAQAALDGTSGIIEVAETAPGLNLAAAKQLAASRLAQYGLWARTLTCTTPRTGLAIGQLLHVFLPQHALTDMEMLITDIHVTFRNDVSRGSSDNVPYFTITAVSGPVLNSWSSTLANR